MLLDLPYVVADQNALRSVERMNRAAFKEGSLGVLVPDVALLEMTKSAQWESTVERSFRLLAQRPDRVSIARSTGELLRNEIESGRPLIDLVDRELTERFRGLLRDIDARAADAFDDMRSLVPTAVTGETAAGGRLDHGNNKDRLIAARNAWRGVLSDQGLNRLRGPDGLKLLEELLASDHNLETFERALAKLEEYPPAVATRLVRERSIVRHVWFTRAALGLWWLRESGLDPMAPKKATNEVLDMEYIVLASFCLDFETNEDDLLKILAAVRNASNNLAIKRAAA